VTNFKNTIISIVNKYGESIENEDLYVDIDVEDPIENLSIERHRNELIVCQYYEQNRDLMRDPEVKFRVEENGEWTPISYRIDGVGAYEYSTEGLEISDTLETWAVNLRDQFL
jgi:hypothetical protein